MSTPAQPSSQPRPQRADALRNRERLLGAARELIARHGPQVGVDEIAAAAGVAVGTLYRHFPTKDDLVEAVLTDYFATVAADAEAALHEAERGARAVDALTGFLGRVLEATASVHAVKSSTTTADAPSSSEELRAASALGLLLERAQTEGDVHADVTVADTYLLVLTAPLDRPAEVRARWLELVLRGVLVSRHPPR